MTGGGRPKVVIYEDGAAQAGKVQVCGGVGEVTEGFADKLGNSGYSLGERGGLD